MTAGNVGPTAGTVTVREALRLLWEADRYPILGNADWRASDRLKAALAVPSPDDPLEFTG